MLSNQPRELGILIHILIGDETEAEEVQSVTKVLQQGRSKCHECWHWHAGLLLQMSCSAALIPEGPKYTVHIKLNTSGNA